MGNFRSSGAAAGTLVSVNTSRGGVPKLPVFSDHVGTLGLSSDRQNDERHHGGADRAVVLYSIDVIRALQEEGHPIGVGTTGENLTVTGVDWRALAPGSVLSVGGVQLEITKYASPCEKIRASFKGADFMRISQKMNPGWSRLCARVLKGGVVTPGDEIVVRFQ